MALKAKTNQHSNPSIAVLPPFSVLCDFSFQNALSTLLYASVNHYDTLYGKCDFITIEVELDGIKMAPN